TQDFLHLEILGRAAQARAQRRGAMGVGKIGRHDVLPDDRPEAKETSTRARAARAGNYMRNRVARPRKMKKPPLSVMAVISTLEPSAGSRPNFAMSMGMPTPQNAARERFSVMAAVITTPSGKFP